ncbi:hypothetical protein [Paraburkholderia dipogonis]|uniref:hypothetical protein n=1 Tax=Paraburkholderia dipogonis TaxID=1211383 RepID=UPI0038B9A29F
MTEPTNEIVAVAQITRSPIISSPDILERIKGAKERLQDGHALMRVPVDPTDPDCVLADAEIEIERLRSLLSASKPAVPEGFVLVPKIMTDHMRDEADFAMQNHVGDDYSESDAFDGWYEPVWDAIIAAGMRHAATPAQSGKPVAWAAGAGLVAPIVRNKGSAQRLSDEHGDGTVIPLYAAPQPSPTAVVLDDERAALLADYIELNMSNYGPDDVDKLNAWAIDAYDFVTRAAPPAAHPVKDGERHWSDRFDAPMGSEHPDDLAALDAAVATYLAGNGQSPAAPAQSTKTDVPINAFAISLLSAAAKSGDAGAINLPHNWPRSHRASNADL